MWRDLQEIINIVPEHNWDYFRKHKFPVRLKNIWSTVATIKWMLGDDPAIKVGKPGAMRNVEGFRVGKLYRNSYNDSANIIPINHPARWAPFNCKNIEIFITKEEWESKVFSAIFATSKK